MFEQVETCIDMSCISAKKVTSKEISIKNVLKTE